MESERSSVRLGLPRELLLVAFVIAAIAGPLVFRIANAPLVRAGGSGQETSAPLPSFEVVSIKPDLSGSLLVRLGGPGDPSRFTATNVTAKMLVEFAYNVKDFQISGGSGWINSEKYDVEAKVEDLIAEQLQKLPRAQQLDHMRPMLQSMLADRFKMKVSHDTKQLPVYALIVAKGGPKIAEVAPPDPQISSAPPLLPPTPGSKLPPLPPGGFRMGVGAGGQAFVSVKAAPITSLTDMLSRQLGRQVVDQTGLKGTYDFTLRWTSDTGLNGGPLPISPDAANQPAADSSGTSIFTALQEQLGLKLESTKGPVDAIVIDHIEQPSEN